MRFTYSHLLTAGLAAVALLAATGRAQTSQTTPPANFDSYSSWNQDTLGSVTLANDTTDIVDITSTMSIADQGWGGQGAGNGVVVQLQDNGSALWTDTVAIASHAAETYSPQFTNINFDLATDTTALANLNTALAGVDWTNNANVTVNLIATPVGWQGWELHVQNATMTVQSSVPDTASSLGLMAAGLLALFAFRRKLDAA